MKINEIKKDLGEGWMELKKDEEDEVDRRWCEIWSAKETMQV